MRVAGLDPGKETGFALWDARAQKLLTVESMLIHQAMRRVELERPDLVLFEDARRRTWFADKGRESLMGAGSIKRDCVIWEDFLLELGVPFIAKPPCKGATKWKDQAFRTLTGWPGRTNEHARDAAILVFQLNLPIIEGMIRMESGAGYSATRNT